MEDDDVLYLSVAAAVLRKVEHWQGASHHQTQPLDRDQNKRKLELQALRHADLSQTLYCPSHLYSWTKLDVYIVMGLGPAEWGWRVTILRS